MHEKSPSGAQAFLNPVRQLLHGEYIFCMLCAVFVPVNRLYTMVILLHSELCLSCFGVKSGPKDSFGYGREPKRLKVPGTKCLL